MIERLIYGVNRRQVLIAKPCLYFLFSRYCAFYIFTNNIITFSNNIIIKGDLTTSNLTILGDSTTLETNVFTTERLEINNIGTGIYISQDPFNYISVFFAYPLNAVMAILFIAISLFHGSIGMRVIIEDYVSNKAKKYFYIIFIDLLSIATSVIKFLIKLKISLNFPCTSKNLFNKSPAPVLSAPAASNSSFFLCMDLIP